MTTSFDRVIKIMLMGTLIASLILMSLMGIVGELPIIIMLPVVVLVLVILLTLLTPWIVNASGVVFQWLAITCILLIDFGLGAYGTIVYAIKAVAYTAVLVASIRPVFNNMSSINGSRLLFLIYGIFGSLSIVYSISPSVTAYTGYALIVLCLMALRIGVEGDEYKEQVLERASIVFSVGMVLFLVYWLAFPQYAIASNVSGQGRVAGIFGSPNSAGGVAAIAAIVGVTQLIWFPNTKGSWKWFNALLCLALSCLVLILTGSRNAAFAAGAACFVLIVSRFRWSSYAGILVVLSALFLLYLFGELDYVRKALFAAIDRTRSGSDFGSFGGRESIWNFASKAWQTSPWFGYGLGGSRKLMEEGWTSYWGQTTNSAHNALLQSLLEGGVVGTLLLLVVIIFMIYEIVAKMRLTGLPVKHGSFAAAILTFGCSYGVFEKSFSGTPSAATGALALCIGIVSSRRARA